MRGGEGPAEGRREQRVPCPAVCGERCRARAMRSERSEPAAPRCARAAPQPCGPSAPLPRTEVFSRANAVALTPCCLWPLVCLGQDFPKCSHPALLSEDSLTRILELTGGKSKVICCNYTEREMGGSYAWKGRGTSYSKRMTEHWTRLPREVVESHSLEILKTCLDVTLFHLLWVTLL